MEPEILHSASNTTVVQFDSWLGRRVLITGHTGFKGAWLATLLTDAGADVYGLSLPPVQPTSAYDLLGVHKRTNSTLADIRDRQALRDVVGRADPEIVFHLAAQALVRDGYRHPVETFETNVLGTVNLLEALRGRSTRAIVVVTSDKCYRNRERHEGYREDDPLGGDDPYSSSKAAAELVAHAYRSSYPDLPPVATARAGNVIGGGDWSRDRLVPDIVQAALEQRPPILRYPQSVRPWQHVLESLSGYLALAERLVEDPHAASAWNFGPPQEGATVAELTEYLLRALGRPTVWQRAGDPTDHEAALLHVDSTKARTELGWSNRLDVHETIEWTAKWYRAWIRGEDMREATSAQIEDYFQR